MKMHQNYGLFGLCLLLLLFSNINTYSQNYYPQLRYENGDTIPYTFPPPDSTYIHNDLIILFRPQSLYLEKLCYQFGEPEPKVKTNIVGITNSNAQIAYLLYQRFPVDSLIADTSLLNAIKAFGGDTLRRMSLSNPCTDTISVGLNGDTIICHNYLWMVLHLNNDTSAVTAAIALSYLYQKQIGGASLNFIYHFASDPRTPNDSYYPLQSSLTITGVNYAWNYQVGNPEIRVAVADCGIDYRNCDLHGESTTFGPGRKVADGIKLFDPTQNFADDNDTHGTCVAGIIGAFTNKSYCSTANEGIAGIAGGWGTGDNNNQNYGCSLISLDAYDGLTLQVNTPLVFQAFEAASASFTLNTIDYYTRFLSQIINASFASFVLDFNTQYIVNYAYQHGLSIVVCSGNEGSSKPQYPACFDNNWLIDVGGSNYKKARKSESSFSNCLDIIAPFCTLYRDDVNNLTIYTTQYTTQGLQSNKFDYFQGTSAAAPHVAGVIALLRSEALDKGWTGLEPEDYEGIIKACALDINSDYDNYSEGGEKYSTGYDIYTGWGHLQADNIFTRLIDDDYKIYHYNITDNFTKTLISSGTYTEINNVFHNLSKIFWEILPQESKLYTVDIYKLTTTFTLPDLWARNDSYPLFVWGRSGSSAKSGLSLDNPLYTSGYTQVTSGTGGNGQVDGIFHNQSLNVCVTTYQYRVYDDKNNVIGMFPPNDQIGANITVFGTESMTSVKYEQINNNKYTAILYPNPATDMANLQIDLKEPAYISYNIYNIYFEKLFEYSSNIINYNSKKYGIQLNDYPKGVYFIQVKVNSDIFYFKLINQGE